MYSLQLTSTIPYSPSLNSQFSYHIVVFKPIHTLQDGWHRKYLILYFITDDGCVSNCFTFIQEVPQKVCRTSGRGYTSPFEGKTPYYLPVHQYDVSGETPEMSHTRNVERKMISLGTIIARYVTSNLPSKETDQTNKHTSRKFITSNSCCIIDWRCVWMKGERERRKAER